MVDTLVARIALDSQVGSLFLALCSLLSAPCSLSLHPAPSPCTLHPTPCTLSLPHAACCFPLPLSVQVCVVSLSLFETLLSLHMEDVMLSLVFQHLLPCSFLLPTFRSQLDTYQSQNMSTQRNASSEARRYW